MQSRRLFMAIAVSSMFTYGCATHYKPHGITGGYSEVQLQEDMFDVNFRGNAYTSREAVEKMLIYRCAELTIENGFDYFVIARDKEHSKKMIVPMGSGHGIVEKPSESYRIKLYKGEKPADNTDAFNANFIIKSIGPQIKKVE